MPGMKRDKIREATDIKKIKKGYYEKFYTKSFENFVKMSQFLE